MPKAILAYGTGNLENSANALTSTANFLKAHGWRAGAGYQPGEPNFAAIQAWNAAGVYQKAIALMGRQIDGGGVGGDCCRRCQCAVVPANAGTHNHRRQLLKRSRQPARSNKIGRGVWVPACAGTTKFRSRPLQHLPRAAFPWHDRHEN